MTTRKGRVSRNEVAQAAGVSPATVSLVVHDSPLVKPSTKAAVQRVIERLGYEPHAAAAALRSSRSQTIGYLMSSEIFLRSEKLGDVDTFHNDIISSLIGNGELLGQKVLINHFVDVRRCLSLFNSHQIDGMVVDWEIDDAVLKELAAHDVPLVVIGRTPTEPLISSVKADEEQGAYTATRHLLSLGHKHIGLISGRRTSHPITDQRLHGYQRALAEEGRTPEPDLIAYGDWSFESGYRAALQLLSRDPRPGALFVLGEVMAAGALKAARRMGLCVPDDLALVTVASSSLVEYTWPELTAIHVPMYDVAKKAVELLVALIDEKEQEARHISLSTKLLIRESSAPARIIQMEPKPSLT